MNTLHRTVREVARRTAPIIAPIAASSLIALTATASDSWRPTGTLVWPSDTVIASSPGVCTRIAAGARHALALTPEGHVASWGDDHSFQCHSPKDLFVQFDGGGLESIALRSDGSAVMWGKYLVSPSALAGPFVAVSNYDATWAGIMPNGDLKRSNVATPVAGPFVAVSCGSEYGVALRSDGTLYGWGTTTDGLNSPPPGQFTAISAGGSHAIALDIAGNAVCWGNSTAGQCAAPPGPFIAVAAGSSHSVALAPDGSVVTWGEAPGTPLPGPFVAIDAGLNFTIALRPDGAVATWGAADYQGLQASPAAPFVRAEFPYPSIIALRADGTVFNVSGDVALPPGRYRDIASTLTTIIGLLDDGTIVQDGAGPYGEDLPPSGSFVRIEGGRYHVAALDAEGNLTCWGLNAWGQCDAPSGPFIDFAVGGYHTVALRPDGTAVSWGDNTYGQCNSPGGAFVAVAAGLGHTVGLRADGSIVAWGRNNVGQCNVAGGPYTTISANDDFTRALNLDGKPVCWGSGGGGCASDAPAWRLTTTGAIITTGPDCDGDYTPDYAEIFGGAADRNGDGIPDECKTVFGDLNGDGVVNASDLAILLGAWGSGGAADLNGDGTVNAADLAMLLGAWS